MKCFYFGCWNTPGHYLFSPGGGSVPYSERERIVYYKGRERVHLDGTLAPRRVKHSSALCWGGRGDTERERTSVHYASEECPEGQFLLHLLDTGYTAIQWWDRNQGDTRGACNSTILLEGVHTEAEMLEALRTHFPHVLENLTKAGVVLVNAGSLEP